MTKSTARFSKKSARKLTFFAIATLAVGSALAGVFEIYDSNNAFVIWYFVIGGAMLVASFAMWLMGFLRPDHQSFGENNRRD